MSRLSVNELNMSITIYDEMKYDDYLDRIVSDLKDSVKEWTLKITPGDEELRDKNIEECTSFVEDVENNLSTRNKVGLLYEVENEFHRQVNFPVFEPDPLDVEFLEDAVIAYVAEEWAIDKELLESLRNFKGVHEF